MTATTTEEQPQPTTVELAAELGLTYRQIDYWISQGYIDGGNPGSGNKRTVPEESVERLRLMAILVHSGLPVGEAADAARLLAMGVPWSLGPWVLTPPSDAAITDAIYRLRKVPA